MTSWAGGLAALMERSARRRPSATALVLPGGPRLTYGELDALADRLRDRLRALGVGPGDRVGFRLHKSLDSVITLFAALKCGAAYVPVDADSPAARGAFILSDRAAKVVITEQGLEAELRSALAERGAAPPILAIAEGTAGLGLPALLDALDAQGRSPSAPSVAAPPSALAYLLYTSGSTGVPKGVALTHGNAVSFVDWCSDQFTPTEGDVFSSHAPFHFDLSILDIHVAMKHGARLVLIGEALGKEPLRLADAIALEGITVWYSTPSILALLANYGRLERHDHAALRLVLFAGEVFPVPQFRLLHDRWPRSRYVNLYGPTETNVCTYYEVPADGSWAAMQTFPIGVACEPHRLRIVDADGVDVPAGGEGELVVHGPNVMQGYWNLPDRDATAFLVDAGGARWYRTGDIVRREADGNLRYLSRRDRMVKRRGYRVELGEVEAGLARHPGILEVAVTSAVTPEGVRIVAVVAGRPDSALSVIALKGFAAKALPPYMVPDAFVLVDRLPRTSTDKVDLQSLKRYAEPAAPAAS